MDKQPFYSDVAKKNSSLHHAFASGICIRPLHQAFASGVIYLKLRKNNSLQS
jgi:hypothetical protein